MPSLVTGIIQGLQSRSAVKNAGKALEDATKQGIAKIETTTPEVNAQVLDAADKASQDVSDAAGKYGQQYKDAAKGAADSITGAGSDANALLKQIYDQISGGAAPYSEAGAGAIRQLADLLSPEGEFSQKFSMDDFEADPGYAFRQAEAQKAIERSAAARGLLNSGATLKGLTRYSQDAASQEYQSAFDRFLKQKLARHGMLSDMAGLGSRADELKANAGMWYGGNAGDNTLRAALAAADVGLDGERYDANVNLDAAGYRADAGQKAAYWTGANKMGSAGTVADLLQQIGNAKAGTHIGKANAWTGLLDSIGGAGDTLLAGGFGDGGFSLKNLLKMGAGGTPKPVGVTV